MTRALALLKKYAPRVLFFAFLLFLSVCMFKCASPHRPTLRIISRYQIIDFENRTRFMIEWAVDGNNVLNASFFSNSERLRFEDYLREVGKVEE